MDAHVGTCAEQAAAHGTSRVVLFDFDGVLMRGDAFARFVRWRLRHSWWHAVLAIAVLPVLLPLFAIRATRMWALGVLVRISLLGLGPSRFQALVTEFARELVARPRIFIRDGISTMRRHMISGDRVVIVTGCEETLVRAIFSSIGLVDLDIIASRLRKGPLGMRKDVHNFGSVKPVQIALRGIAEPWDIVYSDSASDIPMLKRALDPVLVNADARTRLRVRRALRREARTLDWF